MKRRNITKKAACKKLIEDDGGIWWAVDPFHDQNIFRSHVLSIVGNLATALKTSITPISYIDLYRALDKPGYLFPLFPLIGTPLDTLQHMAKHKIDGAIPKIWRKYFKDTIFLTHEPSDAPTLGEKVETISQQATKRKVRFIVLYTHSHSGLKRLFMGSFAETFLLYSKVPTLVISPYCTAAGGGIKQILFPTDFSEQSLTAFNLVIDMASRLKAKVSVVHYSHTAEHSSLFSEAIFGELEEETKKKLAKIYKAGGQLVVKGMKGKVKTTFCVVSGRGTFDPSGAIKKFAKNKKIDLIGLAAQSGTIKSTFLGATSRELARSAPCPVLICRQ